jgi:predicted HTH domain antitoxin
MTEAAIQVEFSIPIGDVPEEHRAEAERSAREAFVMSLLRQGDISAGRAAEVLGIDRWTLDGLMSTYGISPFAENLTPEELAGALVQSE